MASGVIEFIKRLVAPSAPASGYAGIYIDDSGAQPEPKLIDDDGTVFGFKGSYGSYYKYAQNLTPATNTTTTRQAYTTVSYSSLDSVGIYEVAVGFTQGYSNGQRDFIGELNILGTGSVVGVVKQFRLESKDSGADQRNWAFGKIVLTGAELGAGNAILQYSASQNGDTARIYDGIVTITRVA